MRRKRRYKKKRTGLYLILAIALVYTSIMWVKGFRLDSEIKKLEIQQQELKDELIPLQKEEKRLKDQGDNKNTKKGKKDIANEED